MNSRPGRFSARRGPPGLAHQLGADAVREVATTSKVLGVPNEGGRGLCGAEGSRAWTDKLAIASSRPISRRQEPMPRRVVPMLVDVPGAAAPVLVPVSDGRVEGVFRRWAIRARDVGGWTEQRQELTRLISSGGTAREIPPADDRPLIAIVLAEPGQLTPMYGRAIEQFVSRIEEKGGRAVLTLPRADLLFPDDPSARLMGIDACLSVVNGLLGPGGFDVHPRLYKQPLRGAEDTNYPRDRFEADLFLRAVEKDQCAFLGVCRSHQLWNAARGGTLVQDMEKEGYADVDLRLKDRSQITKPFEVRDPSGHVLYRNWVEMAPSSFLYEQARGISLWINSNRHQGVKTAGSGMLPVAWLAHLGREASTVEATEFRNGRTAQWHPEYLFDDVSGALFEDLICQAKACRDRGRDDRVSLPSAQ